MNKNNTVNININIRLGRESIVGGYLSVKDFNDIEKHNISEILRVFEMMNASSSKLYEKIDELDKEINKLKEQGNGTELQGEDIRTAPAKEGDMA